MINFAVSNFIFYYQASRFKNFFHAQLNSMKFILLKNVKMTPIVGILTFISRINTTFENFKARQIFIFSPFYLYFPIHIVIKMALSSLSKPFDKKTVINGPMVLSRLNTVVNSFHILKIFYSKCS